MSYILDALKKAAEQRNAPAPEVRRLLAPSPVATVWPARHITLGAVALGAIAMAVVVWLWRGTPEPTMPTVAAVNATANQETRAAPPAPVAQSPAATVPASTMTPATTASATPPMTPPAEKPPVTARPVAPVAPVPQAPTAPPPASTPIPQPPAVTARPATPALDTPRARAPRPSENPMADLMPAPLRAPGSQPPASRPAPPAAVAAVPPSAATPSGLQRASLRIEVIVYSDDRPKRMAFINGRKYVEGDAVGSGAVLEEIQPNAVVINEDGRRVTLRP